jgi:hypothetical protein
LHPDCIAVSGIPLSVMLCSDALVENGSQPTLARAHPEDAMKKPLKNGADITREALFAGGWYEVYWYKERPATKLGLLNNVARQMGDAEVLLAPAVSEGLIASTHQLWSYLEQKIRGRWRRPNVVTTLRQNSPVAK